MFEYEISTVFVIQLMCDTTQFLTCHFFDLHEYYMYIQLVKIKKLYEDRNYSCFDVFHEILVFL